MSNFEVKLVPGFVTNQKVYKLFRDGKCLIDEFYATIRKDNNLSGELDELVAIIEDVANQKLVPPNRYKKLKLSNKLPQSIYEAKSKHLRLYLINERETGQIHILAGKKGDQDKDLKKVQNIVKDYSAFKKNLTK